MLMLFLQQATSLPFDWTTVINSLLAQTPIAALLFFLLKGATDERQKLTERFLEAQEKNTNAHLQMQRESLTAITKLTESLERFAIQSQTEHKAMVDMLMHINAHLDKRMEDN